ncbi:MAG: hypothetical protein BWY91_01989 [bacterium ADurb.BinA028]|nr:MAG: hypothetical protein BWY91_01989 [bacterium ADurb.BinA028]
MQDVTVDARGIRVACSPFREVPDGHNVDVPLQDEPRYAVARGRADQAVPLEPLRLGPGEVGVGAQIVEVEGPQVDVEPGLGQLARGPVLQVALGVGARHARDADEVDEVVDEFGGVESVKDALLGGRQVCAVHSERVCRASRLQFTARLPTTTGGWPMTDRISAMPCTMAAIASPTKTTRSPDTRPPIIRGPPLQDLPAAAHVEGQIEGDEQGLHQGPSKPTIGPINAMRRRSRHRGNPKCRRGLRRESNSAKQGHRAPKDRLVRDEEVEDWRYHPPCSD